MDDWRTTPTDIYTIPSGMKYAFFIDESGQPRYKGTTENNRFFTLCGCLFSKASLEDTQNKLLKLKHKYWADGKFHYKKGHFRVAFHMAEIAQAIKGYRNANNPFSFLDSNLEPFYTEYKATIGSLRFTIFSVTVDKLAMKQRYSQPYDPFGYSLELLLERVHLYLCSVHETSADSVIVMVESAGKKEDAIHHGNLMRLLHDGTRYIKGLNNSSAFSWVQGVYFCPKHNNNGQSYYGLEIADFCAYPIKRYFFEEMENEEFSIIRPKIYRNKRDKSDAGYGLKKVP